MDELKTRLNIIRELVPEGSEIAYFDYPLHLNVGDLLIYLGTLEYFRDSKYHLSGVYNVNDGVPNSFVSGISGRCVIFCHGGGNFGDLYPKHQHLREDLIKTFPNNKIIILPQSIYFESEAEKNKSKQIFLSHNDVHVFCRDKISLETAKGFTNNTYLVPDMAHYLWNTQFITNLMGENFRKSYGLYQDRIDGEKDLSISRDLDLSKFDTFDWYDCLPRWTFWSCSILANLSRRIGGDILSRSVHILWNRVSVVCVKCSARKLNKYERFVTTRLHGHIFAMLLSKPHKPLDNNYGKISNYMAVWSGSSDVLR